MPQDWFADNAPKADWFSANAPNAAPPKWYESYFSGLNRTLNPFSQENRDSAAQLVYHPLQTAQNMLDAQGQMAERAGQSFQAGHYLDALRHGISYAIPVLGPAIDEAGNKAGSGQLAEGMGEATGIGVSTGLAARGFQKPPAGTTPPPSESAVDTYRQALKHGVKSTTPIEDTRQLAKTGLQYGIPVSEEGAAKLEGLIANLEATVQAQIDKAGGPQVQFTPKQAPLQLTAGAREMPPIPPEAGTTQSILSKADIAEQPLTRGIYRFGQDHIPSLEDELGNLKYTGESRNPAQVASSLDQAKNAQLLDAINQRAKESGLLEAIQAAAKKSGERAPTKLTDAFDVSVTNVIDPRAVAARIDQLRTRFKTVNPNADMSALDEAKAEFLSQYPNPLSYQDAQTLKQNTYAVLKGKSFGEVKAASVEAQKALARGLKEELAKAVPEIADLTPEEAKLLDLDKVLNNAVNKFANTQRQSWLKESVAGGIAGTLTGHKSVAVVTGLLKHLWDDPAFKSKVAIAINKAQQNNPAKYGAPNAATAWARTLALADAVSQASSNQRTDQ